MSATVTIDLDLTAPVLTIGTVTGTTAGELLRIPYTSSEAIDVATLVLGDGRRLVMDDDGSLLSLLLPHDAPDGAATLEAADDVGNFTPIVFAIAGTIVIPRPPDNSGAPRSQQRSYPLGSWWQQITTIVGRSTSRVRVAVTSVTSVTSSVRSSATITAARRVLVVGTAWSRATLVVLHGSTATGVGSSSGSLNRGDDLEILYATGLLR